MNLSLSRSQFPRVKSWPRPCKSLTTRQPRSGLWERLPPPQFRCRHPVWLLYDEQDFLYAKRGWRVSKRLAYSTDINEKQQWTGVLRCVNRVAKHVTVGSRLRNSRIMVHNRLISHISWLDERFRSCMAEPGGQRQVKFTAVPSYCL